MQANTKQNTSPDNSLVLQARIKTLESKIRHLHEAKELEEHRTNVLYNFIEEIKGYLEFRQETHLSHRDHERVLFNKCESLLRRE